MDAGIERCIDNVGGALEVGIEDGVGLVLDVGREVYHCMDVVEGREDGVVVGDVGSVAFYC